MVSGNLYGMFIVGSNEKDLFCRWWKELLKLFAKQIAMAVENDILVKRSKGFLWTTKLLAFIIILHESQAFEEIKRALVYQRPCGYLLLDVDDFSHFYTSSWDAKANSLLKEVGAIIKGSVTDADKVGRYQMINSQWYFLRRKDNLRISRKRSEKNRR